MLKNRIVHVLFGAGTALAMALLLVFGVAVLIWSGTLPTSTPSIALSFGMGLCAFVGGRIAIGRGSDPILISIATGGILCVLMLVICLSVFGAIPFHSKFLATILLTLAGSTLSGLLGDKKKRKKKKKK